MNNDYVDFHYSKSSLTISEQLYTHGGSHSLGMGHILSDTLNIFPFDKRSSDLFYLNIKDVEGINYYKLKTKYIVDNSQFAMGKRQAPGSGRCMLVSLPTAMGLTGKLEGLVENIYFK